MINYRDASELEITLWKEMSLPNTKASPQVYFDDWLSRYRKMMNEMTRVRDVNERRQKRRTGL